MPSESGYANTTMKGRPRHKTMQTAGSSRIAAAAPVLGTYMVAQQINIDNVAKWEDANKKPLVRLKMVNHGARPGDLLRIESGAATVDNTMELFEIEVELVINDDYLCILPDIVTVSQDDLASVLRHISLQVDYAGNLITAAPAGAATESNQIAEIYQLGEINNELDIISAKDFSTSAKQDLAKAVLDNIKSGIDTTNGKDFATSAKQDTLNTSVGGTNTKLDTLIAKDYSTSAKQDTLNTSVGSTNTKLDTLIAKDYATSAKQDALAVLSGAVTETAPASDTASSGLNGRLQRIAQRITSLIALLPASLGQKTMANSLAVTLASDQGTIAVNDSTSVAGTITSGQVSVGATAIRATVTGSAPSASRKRLCIKPNVSNTGRIWIGPAGVTIGTGMEIVGPDRIDWEYDAADYYLISDTAAQSVDILEKV